MGRSRLSISSQDASLILIRSLNILPLLLLPVSSNSLPQLHSPKPRQHVVPAKPAPVLRVLRQALGDNVGYERVMPQSAVTAHHGDVFRVGRLLSKAGTPVHHTIHTRVN